MLLLQRNYFSCSESLKVQCFTGMVRQGHQRGYQGVSTGCGKVGDFIVCVVDPYLHVRTIRSFFERLRRHSLNLPPLKAKVGAMGADCLPHTI